VAYFSAESEAKQSDPRKEAASARAANLLSRVEDLNGGHPELAERGRRPFKPQTELLRQMPTVGSNLTQAADLALFGNWLVADALEREKPFQEKVKIKDRP
jgi:hypothetical protein